MLFFPLYENEFETPALKQEHKSIDSGLPYWMDPRTILLNILFLVWFIVSLKAWWYTMKPVDHMWLVAIGKP